ncbi:MAG: hypothetical protein ACK5TO_06045 [Planctomycetaceae bacterium]
MSSAATGSLGALLMIAPLAAIPVFAIVGVPTIGSMAAAPADELDVSNVEAIDDRPRPIEEGRRNTVAADLFESYNGQGRSRSSQRGGALSDGARPGLKRGRGASAQGGVEVASNSQALDTLGAEESTRPEELPPREFDPHVLLSKPGRGSYAVGSEGAPSQPPRLGQATGDGRSQRVLSEESDRWMKARQRIREYQITWHQLSPEEDRDGNLVFVFTCFMTAAGEPSHRYHASGKTPLEAVEATLRKIDEFRREFQ